MTRLERAELAVAAGAASALGGFVGILLGLALVATLGGCARETPLGVSSVFTTPLPDSLTKWIPAILDDAGEPIAGACPTCGPVLWQHATGHLGLTAVEFHTWTPLPTGGPGVYRPQAIQVPNVNLATIVSQGFAAGDSVTLELSGVNRVEVSPFYGVSADTVDTLEVLAGQAGLSCKRLGELLVTAQLDVRLEGGAPFRLVTSARLVPEP